MYLIGVLNELYFKINEPQLIILIILNLDIECFKIQKENFKIIIYVIFCIKYIQYLKS